MNLCVECFCVGVEPHPHQACHAYHVVDDLSFPLFTLDWGADEDQLLLEAIEMYGLGELERGGGARRRENQGAVPQALLRRVRALAHAPLPDMSKVLGKAYERVSEEDEKDSKPKKAKNASNKNDGPDDDENEDDERDPPATTALASFARPGDERHSGNVPELTGYNVKRDEFDPEYDIDAELPLAEMEFRDTDTDLDKQLKLRMLEVYNKRLAERRARKAFVVDRGLLNVKKQQALERRRTSQEKEIHASVRVFARFLEPNEYEIMLEGLAAESRIRNRIAELKEYRRAGVRTLAEGEAYDAEKRRASPRRRGCARWSTPRTGSRARARTST